MIVEGLEFVYIYTVVCLVVGIIGHHIAVQKDKKGAK